MDKLSSKCVDVPTEMENDKLKSELGMTEVISDDDLAEQNLRDATEPVSDAEDLQMSLEAVSDEDMTTAHSQPCLQNESLQDARLVYFWPVTPSDISHFRLLPIIKRAQTLCVRFLGLKCHIAQGCAELKFSTNTEATQVAGVLSVIKVREKPWQVVVTSSENDPRVPMANILNECGDQLFQCEMTDSSENKQTPVMVENLPTRLPKNILKVIFPFSCKIDVPLNDDGTTKGFAVVYFSSWAEAGLSLDSTARVCIGSKHLHIYRVSDELDLQRCISKYKRSHWEINKTAEGNQEKDQSESSAKKPRLSEKSLQSKRDTRESNNENKINRDNKEENKGPPMSQRNSKRDIEKKNYNIDKKIDKVLVKSNKTDKDSQNVLKKSSNVDKSADKNYRKDDRKGHVTSNKLKFMDEKLCKKFGLKSCFVRLTRCDKGKGRSKRSGERLSWSKSSEGRLKHPSNDRSSRHVKNTADKLVKDLDQESLRQERKNRPTHKKENMPKLSMHKTRDKDKNLKNNEKSTIHQLEVNAINEQINISNIEKEPKNHEIANVEKPDEPSTKNQLDTNENGGQNFIYDEGKKVNNNENVDGGLKGEANDSNKKKTVTFSPDSKTAVSIEIDQKISGHKDRSVIDGNQDGENKFNKKKERIGTRGILEDNDLSNEGIIECNEGESVVAEGESNQLKNAHTAAPADMADSDQGSAIASMDERVEVKPNTGAKLSGESTESQDRVDRDSREGREEESEDYKNTDTECARKTLVIVEEDMEVVLGNENESTYDDKAQYASLDERRNERVDQEKYEHNKTIKQYTENVKDQNTDVEQDEEKNTKFQYEVNESTDGNVDVIKTEIRKTVTKLKAPMCRKPSRGRVCKNSGAQSKDDCTAEIVVGRTDGKMEDFSHSPSLEEYKDKIVCLEENNESTCKVALHTGSGDDDEPTITTIGRKSKSMTSDDVENENGNNEGSLIHSDIAQVAVTVKAASKVTGEKPTLKLDHSDSRPVETEASNTQEASGSSKPSLINEVSDVQVKQFKATKKIKLSQATRDCFVQITNLKHDSVPPNSEVKEAADEASIVELEGSAMHLDETDEAEVKSDGSASTDETLDNTAMEEIDLEIAMFLDSTDSEEQEPVVKKTKTNLAKRGRGGGRGRCKK